MLDESSLLSRRKLMRGACAVGALAFLAPGAFADDLSRTPELTEGPFYPYHNLPLDRDNDLVIVSNATTPAIGAVTQLTGRVLDRHGDPIKNAVVEIWQCDAMGVYLAEGDGGRRDRNFQGYGKFETASTGAYRFRTIKPVPYSGRPAPHIHFKISKGSEALLTTQLFIKGFDGNKRDGVFREIGDAIDRELVSVRFAPLKESKAGELAANFDIVIGRTPADPEADHHH